MALLGIFNIFGELGVGDILGIGDTDNPEFDLIEQLEAYLERLKPYAKMYAGMTGDKRVSGAILATDLIIESAKKIQDENVPAEEKISIIEKLKESL